MAELKGAIFSMAIFIGFVVPVFLTIGIGSIHQHAFLKVTTEVGELVKEEGGVTHHVQEVVENLKDRGYAITFKNKDGTTISTKQDYGDEIQITYNYTYQDVRGDRTLDAFDTVFINRR
ncbi:hypothetical protein [Virgibacillus sp. Bac330]|uniref:hypothetical protein n=1 Tax=Virgibacillus sp. Bac330 TaxID=2419841 RepID=UPI000EF4A31E|nr:hypothetical protein [Virgibacillus sp. Bac330]